MSELLEVSVAKLEAHPNNIRKEIVQDAAFDDLVAGIKSVGIIHPPVVVAHPTAKTKYRLVTGHRRLAAAQKAGLKKIRVDLRTGLSDKDQRDIQYQENKHRVGNSVMERALYVADELNVAGRTIADLAKGMGATQDQVRTSKKLAQAPGKVHAKINDGQMNIEDALILAEFNGDVDAQKALLEAWNTWNWKIEVRRWQNLRAAQKQTPKTLRELSAAGAVVAENEQAIGNRVYAPSELSVDEHVAAGHVAVVDEVGTGQAVWFKPIAVEQEPVKSPEEVEAEAERARAAADLAAELELAGQVRAEALKELIRAPRAGLAAELMAAEVARRVMSWNHWDLIGVPKKSSLEDVTAALVKLGVESMAVLEDVMRHGAEPSLTSGLDGWGPASWGNDYAKGWRDRLHDVYGYQWSDLETGFMQRRTDQVSGECKHCDTQLTTDQRERRLCDDCAGDLCSKCQGELDDGCSYDGMCGDCADQTIPSSDEDGDQADAEVAE